MKIKLNLHFHNISKVGGLNSRDQSRSRSRFLDTSRLTFESVEIYLDGRDQLLKVSRSRVSIEISTKIEILGHKPCRDFVFWTVETSLDSRDRFFKLSRKSRLSRPALCQCRDRDKSRPPSLIISDSAGRNGYQYEMHPPSLRRSLLKVSWTKTFCKERSNIDKRQTWINLEKKSYS